MSDETVTRWFVLASDYDRQVNWLTNENVRLAGELTAAQQRIAELEAALTKAADTFADFHKTLLLLQRETLAVAAAVAEHATRAALSPPKELP